MQSGGGTEVVGVAMVPEPVVAVADPVIDPVIDPVSDPEISLFCANVVASVLGSNVKAYDVSWQADELLEDVLEALDEVDPVDESDPVSESDPPLKVVASVLAAKV